MLEQLNKSACYAVSWLILLAAGVRRGNLLVVAASVLAFAGMRAGRDLVLPVVNSTIVTTSGHSMASTITPAKIARNSVEGACDTSNIEIPSLITSDECTNRTEIADLRQGEVVFHPAESKMAYC